MNTRFNIFLLLVILFIYSCGKDDSPSGTSVNGDVDYFFEVEFAGKMHKIQGNTSSVIPLNSTGYGNIDFANTSYVNTGQSWLIYLGIQDKSSSNYVSGDNFSLTLIIDNASVGSNSGRISLDGFQEYYDSLDIYGGSWFWEIGSSSSNRREISNINLTDLGTETKTNQLSECGLITEHPYCFGNTVKGSYEGILIFRHKDDFINIADPIPVPIKIRFSVPRLN